MSSRKGFDLKAQAEILNCGIRKSASQLLASDAFNKKEEEFDRNKMKRRSDSLMEEEWLSLDMDIKKQTDTKTRNE